MNYNLTLWDEVEVKLRLTLNCGPEFYTEK